jgi:LysR family transcriptional regulator, glycine cleavage system transcriptional activator
MNLLHVDEMRALPPFDALVAFESIARLGSVTLAANELRLTQSAVSHRLKRLESFMGAVLLDRHRTGLTPTPAGDVLRSEVVKLLDDMAALRARSRVAGQSSVLRAGGRAALSHYWLIRRLPRFTAAHPDIKIEIIDINTEAQARAGDVDAQIRWLPKASALSTSTQRILFEESVLPVAAPHLLPGGSSLSDVAMLANLPLLHKGPPGRQDGAEWSWASWFDRLGLDVTVPDGLRFDTISMSLAAALDGAGVALGRTLLVHDAMNEGRLVRILPAKWDMPSSKVHVIRWPAVLSGDARVTRFTAWIMGEIGTMPHQTG